MSQIKITPDRLRSCAGECQNLGNQCGDIVQQTQRLVNELQNEWQGNASNSFAQRFESLRPSMDKFVELYEDLSRQMNGVATTMEEVDQEIASRIGQ